MDMRIALGLAALVLLAGCGEQTSTVSDPGPTAPTDTGPLVVVDGEVQVGCGGSTSWSPSTMETGLEGVVDPDEVTAALEKLLEVAPMDAPLALQEGGVDDSDWFVLAADDQQVTVATGAWTIDGPGEHASTVSLERTADGLDLGGWGDCNLAPTLDEASSWVVVSHPAAGSVDRDTATPTVGVSERECTGARDPSAYLHEPYVVETDETVTVYWTTESPDGMNTCQGNPPTDRTLELAEPLGDRELLDGSAYPPQPVGPPPF